MTLEWVVGLGKVLTEKPLGTFCALLVAAVMWQARTGSKRERENSKQLADLSKEYGATMVRLEHVLSGLTQMRSEYKRLCTEYKGLLAEYGPPPKKPPKGVADE